MLGWTQPDLAKKSSLGLSTVVDFEKMRRQISEDAIAAMVAALEDGGIVLIPENGGGIGVRLKND